MIATKNLSLVEQKKLQWAKEREELVGLCGLWGRPRNNFGQIDRNDQSQFFRRTNLLPPIPGKNSEESVKEYRLEEESETSGYLSDSPKHSKKEEMPVEYQYLYKNDETLRNGEVCGETPPNYWSELDKANNYWAEKKMYKNYKNENWNQQNSDFSVQNPRRYQNNKNHCYGTPDSVSSDDGSRLRWGDRGVGIGHLWDPVINPPDCRLPQVSDHYRQTPKWVEKGLKNCDEGKAEILVINHPDDEQFDFSVQKNYILGQNAPILPEEMEERERKRKKALEHQNAIKKQLEEREFKRKQEREKRIREEKLEEERIKKEQEIERLRYEEEQRRMKQKEEIDKKREEVMKEAIEQAEKRAREDKKRNKRHIVMDQEQKTGSTNNEKLVKSEKPQQPTDIGLTQRKQNKKGRKPDEFDNSFDENKEKDKKVLKDSSSQFEEIQLSNSFQLLNVNGLPVDGGLALMLENSPQENNFILSPEGVQLALLMSPRNANSTNRLIPLSPSFSDSVDSAERTLTPSKYRITARSRFNPRNKSTQTDFRSISSWIKSGSAGKRRRLSIRCGTKTGSVTVPQKLSNSEKVHKHNRCFLSSKYRTKPLTTKISLEDRPKWGINRPSVQYKKQSEKDPYYQKKLKEKLKNTTEPNTPEQTIKSEEGADKREEKELDSVVRLLELRTDDRDKADEDEKTEIILENGFRMNSNLSSPVFVPIDNRIKPDWNKLKELELGSEKSFDVIKFAVQEQEDTTETEEEKTVISGSERFLTHMKLEAIEKITTLREGLKNLQKDYSVSRSTTPFSEKSTDK